MVGRNKELKPLKDLVVEDKQVVIIFTMVAIGNKHDLCEESSYEGDGTLECGVYWVKGKGRVVLTLFK